MLARKHENSLRHFCYCISAGVMLFVLLCPHRNVYVVVVPLRRARGVIRHLKSPDEMDLEEVRTTTMTALTDVCAWKRPINTHTNRIPLLRTPGKAYLFLIQYQCLNISHRYWTASFSLCLCLPSLCLSAVKRHQSKAEGFSAAEAGGPTPGLHHSPFHTCHPTGLLHLRGPAGLRRL